MFHVLKSNYLEPPDIIEQHRPAHIAWLQQEITGGRLILAGRREDQRGGMVITADLVANDPYVKAWRATSGQSSTAPIAPGL